MDDNQKEIKKNDASLESEEDEIWKILETVVDPEIPVLSVVDLGIIREVRTSSTKLETARIEIMVTPTYSGCPAIDMINMNIRIALAQHGFSNIKITPVLSPAWTTDWMSETGKTKLKEYGIAPPVGKSIDQKLLEHTPVQCPQCNNSNTKLVSEFSSTSCKSFYICNNCKEPFEHFKCH